MIDAIATSFALTVLVVVFAFAGVRKLRSLETFEGVVHNFRLLPEPLVRPVAYGLPVAEVALALGLIVPAIRGGAGTIAAALLGVFTLAVAINLIRGRREIDCGCFSSELKQRLSWWLVLRNVALGGLAVAVAAGGANAGAAGTGLDWLLGIAAAVVVAMIYTAASMLSATSQRAAAYRASIADHLR